MVKIYHHNLKNWSQWLENQPLGRHLMMRTQQKLADSNLLQPILQKAVMVGVPGQESILSTVRAKHSMMLLPEDASRPKVILPELSGQAKVTIIETNWFELPLQTASIDLCILPHSLEFAKYPRKLLQEACRVIRPEGLIVIIGWNPLGIWSWSKYKKHHPLPSQYISANKIKNWLLLADYQIEQHISFLFDMPINSEAWLQRDKVFEKILSICCPKWGSAYCLIARAKVIPLNPIKMRWKQNFAKSNIPAIFTHYSFGINIK